MSKKPTRKKAKKTDDELLPDDMPEMLNARAMEQMMNDLSRFIGQQEFDTEEELEDFLNAFMASGQPIPRFAPETPLEEAQELMYEAWDASSKRQRVRLAKKALAISPDCADAYILLGDESKSPVEAKKMYEAAVAAGERALGGEAFAELKGHFWGAIQTRPYMRARLNLAGVLWYLDERDEAIAHLQALLDLNPDDNQGVRYMLLPMLLEEGRSVEALKLLATFEDDPTAMWAYTYALVLFSQQGLNRKATRQLRLAIKWNPYTLDYLLGRSRLPADTPEFITMGGESEAIVCAMETQHLWLQQEGAIEWLRKEAGRRLQ